MRAICRVRSRASARAGTVQGCVRAIAWRSSSDSDTPAAAAFGLPRGELGRAHAGVRDGGARWSGATARHGLLDGGSKGSAAAPSPVPM